MAIKFVLGALLATQFFEIGLSNAIQKRAALGVGKIVTELSNVDGRDFCYAYISAEPSLIPSYVFEVQSVHSTRTITSKLNSIVTETTTLTKGATTETSTVTQLNTITITLPVGTTKTVTVNKKSQTTVTDLSPSTSTITAFYTYDPAENYIPLRRREATAAAYQPFKRQNIEVPAILADSDPLDITAACSKVVNLYPVFTTSTAGTTTQTLSFSTSTTITATLFKTKITKVQLPAVTKTTTVTEVGETTSTIGGDVTVSSTKIFWGTRTIYPTPRETTTTTRGVCEPTMINNPGKLMGFWPLSSEEQHRVETIVTPNVEVSACCEQCYKLQFRGGGCIGYTFLPGSGSAGTCTVLYKKATEAATCPLNAFAWVVSYDGQSPLEWRGGPCFADSEVYYCPQGFEGEGECQKERYNGH